MYTPLVVTGFSVVRFCGRPVWSSADKEVDRQQSILKTIQTRPAGHQRKVIMNANEWHTTTEILSSFWQIAMSISGDPYLPIVVYINVINTYVLSTPSSAECEDLAANSKEPWWSATYYSSQLGSRTLPNPIRNWNPLAVKILRCQSVWSNRLTDVLLFLYKSCDKEIVVVVLAGKYFLFVKTNILLRFIYMETDMQRNWVSYPQCCKWMIIRLMTGISYILMISLNC